MTDRIITDAELDEWAQIERAATPGPWSPAETGITTEKGHKMYLINSPALLRGYCESLEDMLLAAVARNALPRLIAEVRSLRAARDKS